MIFVDGLIGWFDLGYDWPHMIKAKRADGSSGNGCYVLKYTRGGVLKNASFIGDIVSPWGGSSGNEFCEKLAN